MELGLLREENTSQWNGGNDSEVNVTKRSELNWNETGEPAQFQSRVVPSLVLSVPVPTLRPSTFTLFIGRRVRNRTVGTRWEWTKLTWTNNRMPTGSGWEASHSATLRLLSLTISKRSNCVKGWEANRVSKLGEWGTMWRWEHEGWRRMNKWTKRSDWSVLFVRVVHAFFAHSHSLAHLHSLTSFTLLLWTEHRGVNQ